MLCQKNQPFSRTTLTVRALDGSFSWYYGYNSATTSQSPNVLFGTIKSLDQIDSNNLKTLNCTEIANMKVSRYQVYESFTIVPPLTKCKDKR